MRWRDLSLKQLLDETKSLKKQVDLAVEQIKLDDGLKRLADLDRKINSNEIWNDVDQAQALIKKANVLRSTLEPWQVLKTQVGDLIQMLEEIADESLKEEFAGQIKALQKDYTKLRVNLLFKGSYDDRGAILKISSGAGGTEAQDWAEMLERMYLRWAERSQMTTELVDRSVGEEAGIKSATYVINGSYAYGRMKSEHGVHRLVRLSPFNADNLRQTSFALVEVLPEIDVPDEVKLKDEDLKIDVYRSGGHGGQSVNTTDSAVRVTHLPTGIVVAIQNERSQLQNKERALSILRSKLTQLQLEQQADSIDNLRATESASWGAQIRNYVMHPYSLVKDTRTKHEEKDVERVLSGDIDSFIEAYLNWLVEKK